MWRTMLLGKQVEKKLPVHRFDEYKQHAEEKYVQDKVCRILHEQTSADIKEMKGDIKKLLTKNGIS